MSNTPTERDIETVRDLLRALNTAVDQIKPMLDAIAVVQKLIHVAESVGVDGFATMVEEWMVDRKRLLTTLDALDEATRALCPVKKPVEVTIGLPQMLDARDFGTPVARVNDAVAGREPVTYADGSVGSVTHTDTASGRRYTAHRKGMESTSGHASVTDAVNAMSAAIARQAPSIKLVEKLVTVGPEVNPPSTVREVLNVRLSLRFEGQCPGESYELTIPLPLARLRAGDLRSVEVHHIAP